MRLNQFISSNFSGEKVKIKSNKKINSNVNSFLTVLLRYLKKYYHMDINFKKTDDRYYFQSIDLTLAVLVAGSIKLPNNLPEEFNIDLYYLGYISIDSIFNKIMSGNTDNNDNQKIEMYDEPEIDLNTTIIAKTRPFLRVLREVKLYDTVTFKPYNHRGKFILKSFDSEVEREYPEIIRVIQDEDVGTYNISILHGYIKMLDELKISMIRIRYSSGKPILITPNHSLFYDYDVRMWIAPSVI